MGETENSRYFPSFIVHFKTHKIYVHVWKRKTYNTELENMWEKPEASCCYVRVFFLLFFSFREVHHSPWRVYVVIRPSAFYPLAHTLLDVLRYSMQQIMLYALVHWCLRLMWRTNCVKTGSSFTGVDLGLMSPKTITWLSQGERICNTCLNT